MNCLLCEGAGIGRVLDLHLLEARVVLCANHCGYLLGVRAELGRVLDRAWVLS